MKVVSEGGTPIISEGNLMELACRDCAKALRAQGEDVSRVLHRFDFLGNLVETVTE